MLDLLPESVWNSKTRFLDICCKSGNFLIEIYNRLDRILSSDDNFKDPVKRRKHILENQIYGICTDSFEEMMIKRRMLGDPFSDNENISTIAYVHPVSGASKQFRELAQLSKQKTLKKKEEQLGYLKDAIKEKFKRMDFDVVVGNPPYNNDMYLDFVMIGHELAKQFTLMITPAKWQAKGGGQNDLFRKTIVPYMSKIVFYPEAQELFKIRNLDGISYYVIGKCKQELKEIVNKSLKIKGFNNIQTREIHKQLNNAAYDIICKIYSQDNIKQINANANFRKYKSNFEYIVLMQGMAGNCYYDNTGMTLGINVSYIDKNNVGYSSDYDILYYASSLDEAKSFDSYLSSKLLRFITQTSLAGQRLNNSEFWRFVPDPGAFDHIFTDEELYKKYNLTDDEIKLIESVIKERK